MQLPIITDQEMLPPTVCVKHITPTASKRWYFTISFKNWCGL